MGLFWKTEEKWKWGLCFGRVLFVLRGATLCICTLRGHCIVWGDRSCQSRVNWRLKGPPGWSGCTGLWRVHISRAENGARLGGTHSRGWGGGWWWITFLDGWLERKSNQTFDFMPSNQSHQFPSVYQHEWLRKDISSKDIIPPFEFTVNF